MLTAQTNLIKALCLQRSDAAKNMQLSSGRECSVTLVVMMMMMMMMMRMMMMTSAGVGNPHVRAYRGAEAAEGTAATVRDAFSQRFL